MAAGYQIIDEPRPGNLSRLTVDPLWPLLSFMFGGVFISWAWSVFNSAVMGSPTRNREIMAVAFGLLGYFALLFGMDFLVRSELVAGLSHSYTRILLIGFALVPSYYIYLKQSAAFELYEYFGGAVFNGIPLLVVAYLVGGKLQQYLVAAVWNGVQPWIR
ncbi:hypothetical protein [Microbulbifer sediminum]|uniref:hypothetical protein n=1 Tax=Microbulbifer sediminum TaxID=2904250 RepID=UPI001F218359|nr:hypothetical protein [Microbulbifer sediminum]